MWRKSNKFPLMWFQCSKVENDDPIGINLDYVVIDSRGGGLDEMGRRRRIDQMLHPVGVRLGRTVGIHNTRNTRNKCNVNSSIKSDNIGWTFCDILLKSNALTVFTQNNFWFLFFGLIKWEVQQCLTTIEFYGNIDWYICNAFLLMIICVVKRKLVVCHNSTMVTVTGWNRKL